MAGALARLGSDGLSAAAGFASTEVWRRSTAELVALERELAELASSSLEIMVADHLEHADRMVISHLAERVLAVL